MPEYDYLIVGAGLYGSVFAHEMRKQGKRCLVIDKRDHIGGNCHTEKIEEIQVHKYGAHIFHTSNKEVWEYMNGLVEFNRYTNSPVARWKDELYNLPFNMNTFHQLWGVKTPAEAVANGAHTLFFPHGLGHPMGLDVHDLEGMGETFVGYDNEVQRSKEFGLAFLRFGRKLQPGFVMTIEPGIYFIPELIEIWKKENRCPEFINYEKVMTYVDFGGIRIEDDVLVTADGARVLGKPIPKTVAEIEALMAG